jgi:prepilin-type N-terminal cleavage/methylation domain-containing protein
MKQYIEKRDEKGFTLIELLIAIVVVGILAAVAIVGIAGLTNTGGKSACVATADAAKAASAAYYASQDPNAWPADFTAMTPLTNPVLELQNGVTVDGTDPTQLDGNGWVLKGTFTADGSAPPAFDTTATGNCGNA